jgi:hypothetical protein
MSSPDPAPPPPAKKRNTLLIGCLVILLLLVIGGLAVFLVTLYAAKRQYDEYAPQAQQALEQVQAAAREAEAAAKLAPIYAQGMESQARLAMATQTLASDGNFKVSPCPPDPARVSIPVDAEWFRAMSAGVPKERIGIPWQRHRIFTLLAEEPFTANSGDEQLALATAAADRELSDTGTIAVIHTTKLVEPQASGSGHFDGYVQLVKYPAGDSICLVPLRADGADPRPASPSLGLRARGITSPAGAPTDARAQAEQDFQARFWAAEEAALGK